MLGVLKFLLSKSICFLGLFFFARCLSSLVFSFSYFHRTEHRTQNTERRREQNDRMKPSEIEMTSAAPATPSTPMKKNLPKKSVLDMFPIPDGFYASMLKFSFFFGRLAPHTTLTSLKHPFFYIHVHVPLLLLSTPQSKPKWNWFQAKSWPSGAGVFCMWPPLGRSLLYSFFTRRQPSGKWKHWRKLRGTEDRWRVVHFKKWHCMVSLLSGTTTSAWEM